MNKSLLSLALLGMVVPAAAQNQSSASSGQAQIVEIDPIRCWWRTSAGAVRVGENFSVVLTCAVLQNEAVQVVPDETRLDATVVQMPPFEVIQGTHPADLYGPNRRFFQYEYRLRIISPDVIGKDVKIPDPQIHYRINSTVAANTALQGRDHTYLMPPQSVRVLSLVPADAPDIRDSGKEGFGAAEQLAFRASVLQIVAVTAMVLAGLTVLLGGARAIMRTRQAKPTGRLGLPLPSIVRLASRELGAVQQETEAGGWTEDLVARALAGTRITAASALGRTINQQRGAGAKRGEGRLLATGWRRQPTMVSGAATPGDVSRALEELPVTADPARRQLLEDLHDALGVFTSVQYAREATLDRIVLDNALTRAIAATKRVRSDGAWPKSYLRRWMPGVQAEQQA